MATGFLGLFGTVCLYPHVAVVTVCVCIPAPSHANFRASWPHFASLYLVKHNLKNTEGKTCYILKVRLSQKVSSQLLQSVKRMVRGAWVAQSVKRPTSAQVVISQLMGSSPESRSGLTARSLEPASDSVSPSLSAPPLSHSVSLSKINKH